MNNWRMDLKVKQITKNLIKLNKERLDFIDNEEEVEYFKGYHDGILDVLNGLGLGTDEGYYNEEY